MLEVSANDKTLSDYTGMLSISHLIYVPVKISTLVETCPGCVVRKQKRNYIKTQGLREEKNSSETGLISHDNVRKTWVRSIEKEGSGEVCFSV